MPARDWKFRIEDIIGNIQEVLELTQGMDFTTFSEDNRTVKAVLFNLAIIGEAARRVPAKITEKYSSLPWRVMGDLRNVVIHEYFGVDLKIIWETIRHDLPALLPMLKGILQES
jgi:uncharacterized protein with HEPN domain